VATIFKRTRDARKRHAPYWIQYLDYDGQRRTAKGFTDKGLTEQLAAKLENEALLRKRGMIDPGQEKLADQRRTPIEDHLEAFERGLEDNTEKYTTLTMSRVRRVVKGCAIETLADIDAEVVEECLKKIKKDDNLGYRTYNHYLQSFVAFCRWLVARGRMASNPLVRLEPLNSEVDVRHPRRALTAEEFGKLVRSALSSKQEIQCFDGEQRARIYTLSYMTGLRRQELASLTPTSFDLDANPPLLTLQAACSKHRRTDVLPLHPELVNALRDWLRGFGPDEPLFPKLAKRRTWLMVKKDLERVGIPYVTPQGIADFHAAGRHSYITELLRNGASLPEAKELARHSDVRMTLKYTHIGIEDQAKALAALPSPIRRGWLHIGCISRVPARPEVTPDGTDGGERILPLETPKPCRSRASDASSHPLAPTGTDGAYDGGGGNRTRVP
jgi:site-specific recombinase XerD